MSPDVNRPDPTGVIEAVVRGATVADLLDALTPDGWTREGARCPLCRIASAVPIDAARWRCLGAWEDRVPANPRAITHRDHRSCGVSTVFVLRSAVLCSVDAVDRLLELLEPVA